MRRCVSRGRRKHNFTPNFVLIFVNNKKEEEEEEKIPTLSNYRLAQLAESRLKPTSARSRGRAKASRKLVQLFDSFPRLLPIPADIPARKPLPLPPFSLLQRGMPLERWFGAWQTI